MTGTFIPADPGAVLAALPAPVATFDAEGRWSGLNEAAELWLNLSERGVAGLSADDPALIARLRVEPELGPLVAQAAQAGESVLHPRVRFEISDRAGRWTARRAGLDLAPLPDGGVVALIRPEPEAEVDASPRRAARSAIARPMALRCSREVRASLRGLRATFRDSMTAWNLGVSSSLARM